MDTDRTDTHRWDKAEADRVEKARVAKKVEDRSKVQTDCWCGHWMGKWQMVNDKSIESEESKEGRSAEMTETSDQ